MGMKGIGCGAGILGALAILGGCTLFGITIHRALQARPVVERELAFGEEQTVEATVSTDRLCQVAVRVTVVVPPGTLRGRSGGGFDVPYDFPVRYTVVDAAGGQLVSGTTAVASNRGNRTVTQDTAGPEGGTFVAEHGFAKFPPPPDGRLRVRCTLEPAQGVEGRDPRLVVYDRVSEHTTMVGGGFALVAFGAVAAVVGLVLFLVGRGAARRAA